MMENHTIAELFEFIKKTKGMGPAKTFFIQIAEPFLRAKSESYSAEDLKKIDEEFKCINPKCQTLFNLTFHHLFPKRYRHVRSKPIPNRQDGVMVCRKCHTIFHRSKTNKEIFESYFTEKALIDFFNNEWKEESPTQPILNTITEL